MMDEIKGISLLGVPCTLYALLAGLGFLVAAVLTVLAARRHALKRGCAALYALLAGVLGLLLGRGIYCMVRADTLFFGSMGEFLGLSPFFDGQLGSVSIVGVLLGVGLAAPLCARIAGGQTADYLDCAVFPGLLYFTFLRGIEPLSGQGYGTILEDPAFCFAPLARANAWGDWFLAVSFLEAMLGFLLILALLFVRKSVRKSGSLALYAAALLAASQVIPESLRCDDVLYLFVFARVTHIGYAVLLFLSLFFPLLRGIKRGLSGKTMAGELLLMLLGLGVCIGTIFALDKTNLSKLLIYGVMLLTLAALSFLACRRIHKEDLLP